MNNKPVAELLINDGEPWGCRYSDEGTYLNANGSRMDGWIPLYTHPINPKYDPETGEPLIDGYPLFSGLPHPVKELTDEEISELAKYFGVVCLNEDAGLYEFAKAILRKAQEK